MLLYSLFFNDTPTTEIYTLSLHDALPIFEFHSEAPRRYTAPQLPCKLRSKFRDRKSTRLNSSHTVISYAVFCLKKKNIRETEPLLRASTTSHNSEYLQINQREHDFPCAYP